MKPLHIAALSVALIGAGVGGWYFVTHNKRLAAQSAAAGAAAPSTVVPVAGLSVSTSSGAGGSSGATGKGGTSATNVPLKPPSNPIASVGSAVQGGISFITQNGPAISKGIGDAINFFGSLFH